MIFNVGCKIGDTGDIMWHTYMKLLILDIVIIKKTNSMYNIDDHQLLSLECNNLEINLPAKKGEKRQLRDSNPGCLAKAAITTELLSLHFLCF